MYLDREKHESLLNELLDKDLEHSRRSEILLELRNQQTSIIDGINHLKKDNEKLQKDNDDLVVSNSKLFRQLRHDVSEQKDEVEQKEFSETVTLESLEGGQ